MKKFFLFNISLIIIIGTVMMGRYFMGGQNSQKPSTSSPIEQALANKHTSTDEQASSKTIYSWTDKNGVEHITTTPPPENVKIKNKTAFKRSSSEKTESDGAKQDILSKLQKTSPEKTEKDNAEKDNAEPDTLSRMLMVWQICSKFFKMSMLRLQWALQIFRPLVFRNVLLFSVRMKFLKKVQFTET